MVSKRTLLVAAALGPGLFACKVGAVDPAVQSGGEVATPLAPTQPPWRELALPAGPVGPVDRIAVAAGGDLVVARLRLDAARARTVAFRAGDRSVLLDEVGACCEGLWYAAPSPRGSTFALTVGPAVSARLTLVEAGIRHAPTGMVTGVWARGGDWLGGPRGALNADGSARGTWVPDGPEVFGALFAEGEEGQLVYLDGARRMGWDGLGPATSLGANACFSQYEAHALEGEGSCAPSLAPGGLSIAWAAINDCSRLSLCQVETGEEKGISDRADLWAWGASDTLWTLRGDTLLRLNAAGEQKGSWVLPAGARATSLDGDSASAWIGTRDGRILALR